MMSHAAVRHPAPASMGETAVKAVESEVPEAPETAESVEVTEVVGLIEAMRAIEAMKVVEVVEAIDVTKLMPVIHKDQSSKTQADRRAPKPRSIHVIRVCRPRIYEHDPAGLLGRALSDAPTAVGQLTRMPHDFLGFAINDHLGRIVAASRIAGRDGHRRAGNDRRGNNRYGSRGRSTARAGKSEAREEDDTGHQHLPGSWCQHAHQGAAARRFSSAGACAG